MMKRKMQRSIKKHAMAVSAALMTLMGGSQLASAMPTDHSIAGGAAEITATDKVMTIDQKTDRVAIDWQSFSIKNDEAVRFHQPSADAIAVNRVTGGDASVIDGSLTANGNIYIVNPNGVLFGKGAEIDVGGLVASTAELKNEQLDAFMNGDQLDLALEDGSEAGVVNEAKIRAEGGLVALHAQTVENDGEIDAGRVALVSAKDVTLSADTAGKINFRVAGDLVKANTVNKGTLRASDGYVVMTAKAAGDTLASIVNNEGVIEANKATTDGAGHIVLEGQKVDVTGSLDAGENGDVTIEGHELYVANSANDWLFTPDKYSWVDARTISGALSRGSAVKLRAKAPSGFLKKTDFDNVIMVKSDINKTGGGDAMLSMECVGDGGNVVVSEKINSTSGKLDVVFQSKENANHISVINNEIDTNGGALKSYGVTQLDRNYAASDDTKINTSGGDVLLDRHVALARNGLTATIDAGAGNITINGDIDATPNAETGGTPRDTYLPVLLRRSSSLALKGHDVAVNDAIGRDIPVRSVTVDATGDVKVHGITATRDIHLKGDRVNLLATKADDGTLIAGSAANDAVVLSATSGLNNEVRGAETIKTNGKWKVYSFSPEENTVRDLDSGVEARWNRDVASYDAAADAENRYIFRTQPTVTAASEDAQKVVGDTLTADDVRYIYGPKTVFHDQDGALHEVNGYENAFHDGDLAHYYSRVDARADSRGFAGAATRTDGDYRAADGAMAIYRMTTDVTGTLTGAGLESGYGARGIGYGARLEILPREIAEPTIEPLTPEPVIPDEREQEKSARTANADGMGTITETLDHGDRDGIRVLGLADAEIPFFKILGTEVFADGTFEVTAEPEKVVLTPVAKVFPEPRNAAGQYREYETKLVTPAGEGDFRLIYDGSRFKILPQDDAARAIVYAGDETHNKDLSQAALYEGCLNMNITLDGIDAVYVSFD